MRNHSKKTVVSCVALSLLAWPLNTATSQIFRYPSPVPPQQLAIMAWGNSPSDPGQLDRMKAAGFNISGFCRAEDLQNVARAGLTCFLFAPAFLRYDWNSPPPEQSIEAD